MILAARNHVGLTRREINHCIRAWELLCGQNRRALIISEAHKHSSKTRFNEVDGRVYLGADVKPGIGMEANARMSVLACLAHELAHVERFESHIQRPIEFPDSLIDEAEASLHASFMSVLNERDRRDLIEDARDRLSQWFSESRWE